MSLTLVGVVLSSRASAAASWEPPTQLTSGPEEIYYSSATSGNTIHMAYGDGTVYYRRSLDQGTTWSNSVAVASGSLFLDRPIAVDGSNVVITYVRNTQDVTDWCCSRTIGDIFMRQSTDAGNSWGPEIQLSNSRSALRIAVYINGSNVYLTWMDYRSGSTWDIYYRHSSDLGATWSPETLMVKGTNSVGAERPDIIARGNSVHLYWMDARDNQPSCYTSPVCTEIYQKSSSDGGNTWGNDDRLTFNQPWSARPMGAYVGANTIIVSYEQQVLDQDGGNETYVLQSTDDGQTWNSPQRLSFSSGDATHPFVASNGTRAYVTWGDSRSGKYQIYFRESPDGGATWQPEEEVSNSSGTANVGIVTTTPNYVHVIWGDDRTGSTQAWYSRKPITTSNDITPPTVYVSSPTVGSTVNGNVSIGANVSDDTGVTAVQFMVDGDNIAPPVTGAPYSISWDSTSVSDGSHIISASALDAAGNVTYSSSVTVVVSNPPTATFSITNGGDDGDVSIDAPVSRGYPPTGTPGPFTDGAVFTAGRRKAFNNYEIGTPLLRFDTSSIPDNATITSATLKVYVNSKSDADNRNLVGEWYPASNWPIDAADYTATPASNALAANDITAIGTGQVDSFVLQTISNVSKTGYTGLRLHIDGGIPNGDNYVQFASSESTSAKPQLVVTYSLPANDTTPPSASISSPLDGSSVSGTAVNLTAGASDDIGVAGVQFKVDGSSVGPEDTTSPYSMSWDSTSVANGSHVITAVARDAAGNVTISNAINVTVNNTPPDTVAPTPPTGLRVTQTTQNSIAVAWDASTDNVGVSGYRIYNGPTLVDTTNNLSDDFINLACGTSYTSLGVVAFDAAGNTSALAQSMFPSTSTDTCPPPPPDTTPPTVSMTGPSSGSAVAGTSVTLSANAVDNVGVVGVQFKVDGSSVGSEDTASPYTVTWDSTSVANGSHSVTAVARDAAGNATTTTSVIVNVDNSPPSVAVTQPANDATVTGSAVAISATASDNVGVVGVQFKLDGTSSLGSEDTTSPYGLTWDTRTVADGTHTITATARDAAGNVTVSTGISIIVKNSPTNTSLPAISGTVEQGSTLSASTGSWSGSPTSFTYQWLRCDSSGSTCANISGATTKSYALAVNDVGLTIRVKVSAINFAGTVSANSNQTTRVVGVVTFTIAASGDDGDVSVSNKTSRGYPPSGTPSASTNNTVFTAGRRKAFGNYEIIVPLLRFNTASLPDNATVTSATLNLRVNSKADANNRNLVGEWYAGTNWPIDKNDYTLNSTANALTGADITAIKTAAVNSFNLLGLTNVSTTGYTGLRLNVDGGVPTGDNYVQFASFESSGVPKPQLVIKYTLP